MKKIGIMALVAVAVIVASSATASAEEIIPIEGFEVVEDFPSQIIAGSAYEAHYRFNCTANEPIQVAMYFGVEGPEIGLGEWFVSATLNGEIVDVSENKENAGSFILSYEVAAGSTNDVIIHLSSRLDILPAAYTFTMELWSKTVEVVLPPSVTTESATDITTSSATLNASIGLGDYDSVDAVFYYRAPGATGWENTGLETVSTGGAYSKGVAGLESDTAYEFKTATRFDGQEGEGSTLKFTTEKVAASVTTESATGMTTSSATLNASIDYGNYASVDISFFYREVGGSWVDTGLDTVTAASYLKGITGLKEETSYEFYAYIEFDGLDDTGATKSFTTTAIAPPEKATLTVDTTPVKGEVFVDGVSWGTAPQTMKLDAGTYTVSFGDVPGYETPTSETVTLAAGETKTVTGIYTEIPTPAEFELSNLVISPTEVEVGETVTISVDVANVGGTAGTCSVTLTIDGTAVDAEDITLAAGATGTVAFEVTEEVAGTYAVDVDGLTREFTVTTPPLRVPLEVVATVLIVALLFVIFIWVRRRRT